MCFPIRHAVLLVYFFDKIITELPWLQCKVRTTVNQQFHQLKVSVWLLLVRVRASVPVARSLSPPVPLSLLPCSGRLPEPQPRCIHSVGARHSSAAAESMSLAMFVRASDVVSLGARRPAHRRSLIRYDSSLTFTHTTPSLLCTKTCWT